MTMVRPNEVYLCNYCKLVVEGNMVFLFSIDGHVSS